MQNKILSVLRDRNGFLKEYLKDNLPRTFYTRTFNQKISHVDYMREAELPSEYKDELTTYWRPYEKINPLWHKAYLAASGIWDVRYIPEDIFYRKIEPTLNRAELSNAYVDKNMYEQFFGDFKMPVTIVRNINGRYFTDQYEEINEETALSILHGVASEEKFVIKPTVDSGSGKNVQVRDFRGEHPNEIKGYLAILFEKYEKDFIAQKYVYQHELLSQLHPDSLNTLRVISLRFKGDIYILSSVLRMGDNGSNIDNGDSGYLTVGVNKDGKVNDVAMNHYTYEKYEVHPYSQIRFKDVTVPSIQETYALVEKAHKKLFYFDIVSWDIAINRSGDPVFIEMNLKTQDINYHQRVNGPLFGGLTDDVLAMVYHGR